MLTFGCQISSTSPPSSTMRLNRRATCMSRVGVKPVHSAAFVPCTGSYFLLTTSLFPTSKLLVPSPNSCRVGHGRAYTISATHAPDLKTIPNNPETTSDSKTEIVGEFHFDSPQFQHLVSGEWFGYQVSFSAKTGAAQNIEVHGFTAIVASLV